MAYRIENAHDMHTIRRDQELLQQVFTIVGDLNLANQESAQQARYARTLLKEVLQHYDETFAVFTGETQKRVKLQKERIERKQRPVSRVRIDWAHLNEDKEGGS